MADSDVLLSVPALHRFTAQVFAMLGMTVEHASMMADQLTWAEARGYPWLGARKIIQYAKRIRSGATAVIGEPRVVKESASFLLYDGGNTFNHIAGIRVMRRAMEKARNAGLCAAVARNLSSASCMGYYVDLAIKERMIGIAITNAPPLMAPHGSKAKLIGNQAFAIGCPADKHSPILFDTALSKLTLVAIHRYQQRGEVLPEGAALGVDGLPTRDPAAALAGILLPMAGHRGSGLAILWEVLTGVLSGADRFLSDVTMPDVFDRPQAVSTFYMAIDPAASMRYETFTARVDELIERIHAAAPADGMDRVRLPGEGSAERALEAQAKGIFINAALAEQLGELGNELGVHWP